MYVDRVEAADVASAASLEGHGVSAATLVSNWQLAVQQPRERKRLMVLAGGPVMGAE